MKRTLPKQFRILLYGIVCASIGWVGYRFMKVTLDEYKTSTRVYQTIYASHQYRHPSCSDIHDDTPSCYYIDLTDFLESVRTGYYGNPPFDSSGIPIVDYHHLGWNEIGKGRFYNPVTIAQYALAVYDKYLSSRQKQYKLTFLNQAKWFLRHGDRGLYRYQFAIPSRDLEPGWISAMAQGQAISVLIRAYIETGDTCFMEKAKEAIRPFYKDVRSGGVVFHNGQDIWLEEYPHPSSPSHVLNGAIFALFGLWDYYRVTNDERVKHLFDRAVNTLARNLHRYEKDGWVLYELSDKHFVRGAYYPLHIALLRALFGITNKIEFAYYADRWDNVYALYGIPYRVKGTVKGVKRRLYHKLKTLFK